MQPRPCACARCAARAAFLAAADRRRAAALTARVEDRRATSSPR